MTKLSSRAAKIIILAAATAAILPIFWLGEGRMRADAFGYMVMGQNMAAGLPYSYVPEHYLYPVFLIRPPLFSVLLAAVFRVGGVSIGNALLVSQVMTALSLAGVFSLTTVLYGRAVGLAALGIATASAYLTGIAAHIEIDPAVTAVMLFGSAASILFLDRPSVRMAVAAGLLTCGALLVKEIAVMLMPLPFYLYLSLPSLRRKENLAPLAAYSIAFAIPVGAYLVYFYLMTGRIFLVARAFESLNWTLLAVVGLAGLALLSAGLALAITQWGKRIIGWVRRHAPLLGPVVAVVLWMAATAVLMVAFAQNTAWVRSPGELVPRLIGFQRWLEQVAAPLYWPLVWFLPASLVVAVYGVYKRQRSDLILLWLVLCTAPLILTLSPNVETVRVARYGFPIFWLIIIILARAVTILADMIFQAVSKIGRTELAGVQYITPAILWAIGLSQMLLLPSSYDYNSSPLQPLVFNTESVKAASAWLRENTADDAVIASTNRYIPGLEFYTGRNGQFKRIYSWDGDQTEQQWPQTTTAALEEVDGEFALRDIVRKQIVVNDPLYIQYSVRPTFSQRSVAVPNLYYVTLSQDALLTYLQENDVDYLVLSTGRAEQNMLGSLPHYYEDHPAFEPVFQYTWFDDTEQAVFDLYILRVDREKLERIQYPVEVNVSRDTWGELQMRLATLAPGDQGALCRFILAMGGQPMMITPDQAGAFWTYSEIAQSCEGIGETELAAYHYYRALKSAPELSDVLVKASRQLLSSDLRTPSVWLLAGNIELLTDNWVSAQQSLAQGLALAPEDGLVRAALLETTGRLALQQGNYQDAANAFGEAAKAAVFESTRNIGLEALAEATATQFSPSGVVAQLQEKIISDPTRSIQLYIDVLTDPILRQTLGGEFEQALILAIDGLSRQHQEALARSLLQIGAEEQSPEVVQRLAEVYLTGSPPVVRTRREYRDVADLAVAAGDSLAAEAIYSEIIALWPDDYRGYYMRGDLRFRQLEDPQGAGDDLERALALAPKEKEIYLLLSEIYEAKQETEALARLFDIAVAQNEGMAWPHSLAGQTYLRAGQADLLEQALLPEE